MARARRRARPGVGPRQCSGAPRSRGRGRTKMPRMVGLGALAVAALLLIGLWGWEVAAPATAQVQGGPTVPVLQAPVGPPPPGAAAPATTITVTPHTAPVLDLGRLGLPRAAGAPPPLPATGVIGTGNA